jgi:hypothetical protein
LVCWNESRSFRSSRCTTVRVSPTHPSRIRSTHSILPLIFRYLQNGNILAAQTFIKHFTSSFTSKYPSFTSTYSNSLSVGSGDEIIITSDSVLNFAQVAVRLCQRAQGDKNKLMRESWVRLCGRYQTSGGVLATREIRKVRWVSFCSPVRMMKPS